MKKSEQLVGRRVEIPVHHDLWAQGARHGVVTAIDKHGVVRVKMDHPGVKRLARIAPADRDDIKVL